MKFIEACKEAWSLFREKGFKEGYGWKKEVEDLTVAQTIYRLFIGLFEVVLLALGMNVVVGSMETRINRPIMQVALDTGNMFYVYVVMIAGFIVLTGVGLYFVLKNDVGEIILRTYKQRFDR
ncbi:hypothetical protein BLD48_15435 [Exiguobacterium sp. KRL4]|uniref:hypothetical protein n=1 Tax=Exiguobacterium sp. KRL4 TaxID=1914536 RepID=UPI0008F84EAA|nr:hypothetical protein [Exiguobacterium sp. KRL4]OIN65541.1 hypothetical protein BLD48_15435 [Exiguobacterium sp. KRL4]